MTLTDGTGRWVKYVANHVSIISQAIEFPEHELGPVIGEGVMESDMIKWAGRKAEEPGGRLSLALALWA